MTIKRIPKARDKIYVGSQYFIGHGWDDFAGGIATVKRVVDGISAGRKVPFIEIVERPGHGYNWEILAEKQKELKKRFGKQKAHSCPDNFVGAGTEAI